MSKNDSKAPADKVTAPAPIAQSAPDGTPTSFPLTLDEFCRRVSMSDRRVEYISGFHHVERAAKRLSDTEVAYRRRFDAHGNQPA